MKANVSILFIFIFLFISSYSWSQPEEGTWSIGGSSYRIKIKNDDEPQLTIYELNTEANYFIIKNLSVGGRLHFRGGKDFTEPFEPTFHRIYFSPLLEGYIVNQKKYGISLKGAINFRISNTNKNLDKNISSYSIGPKFLWNITDNLGTYIWIAYRNMDDLDNSSGFRTIAPSDNFDIRWGFSYFLHKKNN